MSDAELHQIGSAISVIQSFMVSQIVRPYLIPWYRISGETATIQRVYEEEEDLLRFFDEEGLRPGVAEPGVGGRGLRGDRQARRRPGSSAGPSR